jgi:hypothetical protein
MSRIRSIVLLAALAVSMLAVASASAENFFVEGVALGVATPLLEGPTGEVTIGGRINNIDVQFICQPSTLKMDIEKEGKSSAGKVALSTCKMMEIAGGAANDRTVTCPVAEPITLKFSDKLIPMGGLANDELIGEKAEETFAEIEVKGAACAFKGTYKFKGTTPCSIQEPVPLRESMTHYLYCLPTGSALRLGVPAAYINMVVLAKVENMNWSAR